MRTYKYAVHGPPVQAPRDFGKFNAVTAEVELHEYARIFGNKYGIRGEYALVCEFARVRDT